MKKSTKRNLKIGVVVAAISFSIILIFMFFLGSLSSIFGFNTYNFFNSYNSNVPADPQVQFYQYNVQITIAPNPACVGDTVTGTITSNIPNGICSIFVNPGTGWQILSNANLDASGHFSTTMVINQVMSVLARAVCCDSQGNCRISNQINFVSQVCNNPPAKQYFCCYAMGLESCYQNGCPPSGYQVSGPYSTVTQCQANCGTQGGNGAGGTACSAIWNPSETTCSQGTCTSGTCTFVPATLVTVARCECQ